ncbi:UNVERIFIED_CONTAM: hypothetical protein PYX00_004416 [Menopon gallinae]|uniref:Uncharacterized protein n=1 Tax=Menopon gallinae TaxID=328185 RepID=A0AAW2I563_9NEOP
MVTCGHQFHMGDECDWLISSSAVCPINGNSTATEILKGLIEAHCNTRTEESEKVFGEVREIKNDTNNLDLSFCLESGNEGTEEPNSKMPEFVLEAREMPLEVPHHRKAREESRTGSGYCLSDICDEEESDENQHVDGCPIKWFCRKRTRNGWGPCIVLRRNGEENAKALYDANGKRFRDRIPLEVKIGKINLNKREPFGDFRNMNGIKKHGIENEQEKYKKFEVDPKVAEMQKKRLEAKLNWRPFQENDDQEGSELSYSVSSRDGYLRPRSAFGGKALSILLFPYHHQNCTCGWGTSKERKVPKIRVERASSEKSKKAPIPLEAPHPSKPTRPKTFQATRRVLKSQKRGKRLQVPKQMDVLLETPKNRFGKHSNGPQGVKKPSERIATSKKTEERIRNAQSLTSLYYQLEEKSKSGKVVDEEHLEKMLRELSMEDNIRGIRSILAPGFSIKKKRRKRDTSTSESHWSSDDSFRIICKPVQFSQRRPKSRILSESAKATVTRSKTAS